MTDNNLWILTEEKLKISVLKKILKIYIKDNQIEGSNISDLKIKPIIENNFFKNKYEIENFKIKNINKIYSIIVEGETSFGDHIVFKQKDKPQDFSLEGEEVKYVVEDTKTDSDESRNTVFGQREAKPAILRCFNKNVPFKYFITNCNFTYNEFPPSPKFDARCLVTNDVEVSGIENFDAKAFNNVKDLIDSKNAVKLPPPSNVPFRIKKIGKNLNISKKIVKGDALSDPSIGQLLGTSCALRKLGFSGEITITKHGLNQKRFDKMEDNKLLLGCLFFNIKMEGIKIKENITIPEKYWSYTKNSEKEKNATILFHHLIDNSKTDLKVIFHHHAGCSRGYMINRKNKEVELDKSPKGKTPDLIVSDPIKKIIYMIEGKTHKNFNKGIKEIENFPEFFKKYIVKNCGYNDYKMESWLILSGTSNLEVDFKNVLFNLKEDNSIKLNDHLNDKFKEVFKGFLN